MNTLALRALRPIIMQPRVRDAIIAHAMRHPYSTIRSRDGTEDYMHRGWVFNPYTKDANGQYVQGKWGSLSIRVHHILLPDDDPHRHNHPFDALSLIMKGWYIESLPDPEMDSYHPRFAPWELMKWRREGDINVIKKTDFHRITKVSPGGVWTLFITNDVKGEWGFDVDGQFIEQTTYFATRGKRVLE